MRAAIAALPAMLAAHAILLPVLFAVSCTSMRVEPRSEYDGVVIARSWSFNFLTITIPLNPRERAIDILGNASLPDVRNAEVTTWPHLIWPINWLNGLLGFCAAEVRADYGLPPPVDSFPVPPAAGTGEGPPLDPESAGGAPETP